MATVLDGSTKMTRRAVASSTIAAIGYDAGSRVLEVEFLNGSVYRYLEVPHTVHDGIMAAASKGRYLAQVIKDRYRFVKA